MKYFTKELLMQISAPYISSSKRKEAEEKWKDNIQAYLKHLNKLLPHMPKKTRSAIMEITNGDVDLHDFRIAQVNLCSVELEKKIGFERPPLFFKRDCILKLTNEDINVEIIMSNVKKASIDIEYWKESNAFDVRWGYCEFSYKKPKIVLSILCDSGHIWEFEFSELEIVKTQKEGNHENF